MLDRRTAGGMKTPSSVFVMSLVFRHNMVFFANTRPSTLRCFCAACRWCDSYIVEKSPHSVFGHVFPFVSFESSLCYRDINKWVITYVYMHVQDCQGEKLWVMMSNTVFDNCKMIIAGDNPHVITANTED